MSDDPAPSAETQQASGPDLSALRQSADEMEKHLESLQNTAGTARAQLWIMVGLLVAILVLFGFSTYRRVKENFSGEKAANAAQQLVPQLTPIVQRQAETLVAKVGPVYVKLVEERLAEGGGVLAEDASKVLESLPQQCFDDLQKVVNGSFTRVGDKVAPELAKTFPGLTKVNVSDRLTEHFNGAVYQNADILQDHLKEMFQKELDQLNDAMASFEIPEAYAKKSNEELNFLMLHYMFLMMDDAATSYEEGAFFPIELVSDAQKTAPRKTRPKATSPAPEKPAEGGNGEATSADKQSAAGDRPAAPKS